MIDPQQLAALAAVLQTGSFEAAGARLGVTQSAISQRIRALEDLTGAILVQRGHPCRGTEAGVRLARHHDDLTLMEHALAQDLRLIRTDRPTVRLAINADSVATWFLPALKALPDALFDIIIEDQDETEGLLRRGAVMAAITARATPVQGCDAYPLGRLRYLPTASPAFMARWFGAGVTRESLGQAPMITFNAADLLQRRWVSGLVGADLAPPTHMIGSSHAFVDAALLGLGWGMNPLALVQTHIAEGRLLPLTPEAHLDVALNWQVARLNAQALLPLTDAVRRAAAASLLPALK